MSRIQLLVPTTFYVSTTGSDSLGAGSISLPWRTPLGAYNNLQQTYDAGGQPVRFELGPGTFTTSNQLSGPLVGQYRSVIFRGQGHASTIIKPSGGGYAFGVDYGAAITLQSLSLDMSNAAYDTLSAAAAGSSIQIGETYYADSDVWFGYNLVGPGGCNDMTIQTGALLIVAGNYTIDKPQFQTTGTWSSGSNTITLANPAGILPNMGITGAHIPPGAYVASKSGNSITLGYVKYSPITATTGPGSGTTLVFMTGGQAHLSVSDGARVFNVTNNEPNCTVRINIIREAFYQTAFVLVQGLAEANIPGFTFQDNGTDTSGQNLIDGVPFWVWGNSTLNAGPAGVPYLPSTVSQQANATGTAGSNQITVNTAAGIFVGNVVNALRSTAATGTSGASVLNVANSGGIDAGSLVYGRDLVTPTTVVSVVGNVVTINTVTGGTPSGTYYFTIPGIPLGTRVTRISGNVITLSNSLTSDLNSAPVWFSGAVFAGGQYDLTDGSH